ncbi:MAG TPA: ROK family protein [Ruminiclostridium sp.]|nr:ROK family protein [Ruminiclostridium sp.]
MLGDLYLGLDIGGSNIRAALTDSDTGLVGDIQRRPFKRLGNVEKEVEENICSLIEKILIENGSCRKAPKAVGISLAALFNRENGKIEYWPNNHVWNGFPLKEYLEEKYKTPVILEDDANSAAIGELHLGAARGFSSFVYLTVSTGIGCGIILNGKIYSGTHGWAGELGHIKVPNCQNICKCGASGCLQTVASGPALLNRAERLAREYHSPCADGLSRLEDAVKYAVKGEQWAVKVFREAGEYLADALTNLVMLLDIPLIVIGGGVSRAGDVFILPIIKALNANLEPRKRRVEVRTALCGDDCGVIGASLLAVNQWEADGL